MNALPTFHFFDISVVQFNLFSFMMGMFYAFLNQSWYGKSVGQTVIVYFMCLAGYYAMLYNGVIVK